MKPWGFSMKVLVVEDEKIISDAVRKILKDAGFESDAVYDGEDGAYYAEEGDYDLIILDIMLPRLLGLSVIEKIRKAKVSTPVLMLMYGREAQSKTRIASPATIPKSGERNRKIHSCMLYLISI